MQNISETRRKINEFCQHSGKFHPDAYEFITACVIEQINNLEQIRHLSAEELLGGLKKQLQQKFGFLAGNVLDLWNIRSSADIGEIVFDLIHINILSAADDDKISDFDINFDLIDPATPSNHKHFPEIPQID